MTQEEKAKAYDEALEKARQFSEHPLQEDSANIVEYIFPELKKSEGERIRKEIIVHIKWCEDNGYCAKEEMTRWINWLEKQGEQKPAENKGMDLVEEEMTPFQKKVFCIVDTAIEEEQGLSNICNELLALAIQEIEQKPAWSEEDERMMMFCCDYLDDNQESWLKSLKDRIKL